MKIMSSLVGWHAMPASILPLKVTPFLAPADVRIASAINHAWKRDLSELVVFLKEDEYCRRIGYPAELVALFRARKLSLYRLPVLDVKARRISGIDAYDNLLENQLGVMRVTGEYGQIGLVIPWVGRMIAGTIPWIVEEGPNKGKRGDCQIGKVSGAVILSKMEGGIWRFTTTQPLDLIYQCIQKRLEAPNEFCVSLLDNNHFAVERNGDIHQIKPTSAITMPPKPAFPAPEILPPPVSVFRRIWNAVTEFFLWIASLFSRFISFCRGQ